MATILYLNDRQVFPAADLAIKLTLENPYFSQSDAYTLDVTLPMHIRQNRLVLGHLHRLDHTKQPAVMTARLYADGHLLLRGSAVVTQVTERQVRVQLVGGNSEVNLLSLAERYYIDEMNLGDRTLQPQGPLQPDPNVNWMGIHLVFMQALDETSGEVVNRKSVHVTEQQTYNSTSAYEGRAPQPHLFDVLRRILAILGYTLNRCDADVEPWNHLYIASARRTFYVAHALPHWTVREFLNHLQQAFNCTLTFDQQRRTCAFIANGSYFGSEADVVSIDPADEYQADVSSSNDTHALAADNISFALSASPSHDYDCLSDDLRQQLPRRTFTSHQEAVQAYTAADVTAQAHYLYESPQGVFTRWIHDYGDVGVDDYPLRTWVDFFRPLVRDAGADSSTELKIVPVAISDAVPAEYIGVYVWSDGNNESHYSATDPKDISWRSLSLECPAGHEELFNAGTGEELTTSVQQYVEGAADVTISEKEDLMQVFFVDDQPQTGVCGEYQVTALMPFVDAAYKPCHLGNPHRPWSLALCPSATQSWLGQLHGSGFTLNMRSQLVVRFLVDPAHLPTPSAVFIIRSRRYACEKIELSVNTEGVASLATGYFREILDEL